MELASEWLAAIYAGVPTGHVVLWRNDSRGSVFIPVGGDYKQADTEVIKCKATPGANLYFGLGVQPKKVNGRGSEKMVTAIPGVWADIDYAEKAKSGGNQKQYPPKAIAEQAMKDMPIAPSVVVQTGGGIHVYWLLDEPFLIESDGDRERARKLTWGWQSLIKRTLARLHPDRKKDKNAAFDVDSTGDLARVLRLPTGWMHSYEAPVRIRDGYEDPDGWSRYNVETLEEFAVEITPPTQQELLKSEVKIGKLILASDANPDTDQFAALMDNSPEFKRVWNHQKRFESVSEYEMSLATRAAQANWPEQEIANLVIAHRRKYDPGKLDKVANRVSYMVPLLKKAIGGVNHYASIQSLSGMPDEDAIPDAGKTNLTTTESDRDNIIKHLSNIFGVKIDSWIQLGRQDPIYTLILADGDEVEIGGAKDVIGSCFAFRTAIYASCFICMKPVSKGAWPGICGSLAKIVQLIDPDDGKMDLVVLDAVETYLSRVEYYNEDGKAAACSNSDPILIAGQIHISLEKFRRYLNLQGGDKWERKKLQNYLRAAGFGTKKIDYRNIDTNANTKRCYWTIDAGKVGIGYKLDPEVMEC